MRVIDPKRILKLMAIQDVSARALAQAVGYSSHSYVTRILRGEITTVTPERAARIARFFGVGIDDLFVPRLSSDSGHSVSRRGATKPAGAAVAS
ncbi:helix-turn-helix transcriptional regulator [Nocardioides sp. L-11A]|uniref:helix-turn-helix domain-containing protein n=1 Tax=Nocardioides sp. L-11A TaxID=3043848 RepID=UPI00249C4B52|nr:helix-turn-helix transcriptional regulator [Nocardioides sp. L-11A]